MIQHETNSAHALAEVIVKTDEDYDIDDQDSVVFVLEKACRRSSGDEAEPVELSLPSHPRDGHTVRLIATGQSFTLDGGDFVIESCDDDDDDAAEPTDPVFAIGTAIDVVFSDLAFSDCDQCSRCGCSKKTKCSCPKGRWYIVGLDNSPSPQAGELLAQGRLGAAANGRLNVTRAFGVLSLTEMVDGAGRCWVITAPRSATVAPAVVTLGQDAAEGAAFFQPRFRVLSVTATTITVEYCIVDADGAVLDPSVVLGTTGGVYFSTRVGGTETFEAPAP